MRLRIILPVTAIVAGAPWFILGAASDDAPVSPVPDSPAQAKALDRAGKLKPGDTAPDFTLNMMHSQRPVTLSGFRNQRAVALIFGSYT